jgi:hypothetical protein
LLVASPAFTFGPLRPAVIAIATKARRAVLSIAIFALDAPFGSLA